MFKWSKSDIFAIPIMLAIIVALTLLLHFLLKNKSDKIKNIPLHIIAISLIILEVTKQIYYLSSGSYSLKVIPVHFCSLIVVIISLAQFFPKKYSLFFQVPAVIFSTLTLFLLLAYPYSMIGNSSSTIFLNFPSFHAFVFHSLVVAYPIFRLCLISHDLKWTNILSLPASIVFYACYAVPIAFTFNFNYMNILYNAFTPLETFRLACGQIAYDIVWFLITIAISCLLFVIWYTIKPNIKKWYAWPLGYFGLIFYGLFNIKIRGKSDSMNINKPILANTPFNWFYTALIFFAVYIIFLLTYDTIKNRKNCFIVSTAKAVANKFKKKQTPIDQSQEKDNKNEEK